MSGFLLDTYPAGSVIAAFFHTFNSSGAAVTISNFAVTDIEIYKGTSMTQRASDNGYALLDTDGVDLDGTTGIHGISIDLSDNSDASFYAAGSIYHVVIASITADGQTVNFVLGSFRIMAAESVAGVPGGVATSTDLATVDTVVDAIKVKTDSLTFTVANVVDANIQRVNDVAVAGTGAPGDEWGPYLATYDTWGR